MTNELPQKSYSQIIKLIFENAQQSVKDLNGSINLTNTKLSAVIGFGVLLIKFVGDLPNQSLEISSSNLSQLVPCYSCLILRVFSLILLVISILIGLKALLPRKGSAQIISPSEQVEKCLELSEDEYRLLFIKISDQDIESLAQLRDWKSKRLTWSGTALIGAAALTALELLLINVLELFA